MHLIASQNTILCSDIEQSILILRHLLAAEGTPASDGALAVITKQ